MKFGQSKEDNKLIEIKLNVDNRILGMLVDAVDCLVHHFDEYGYRLEEVVKFATLGVELQKRREGEPVAELQEEKPAYDEGDCPKGTHFVLGKGCVEN